MSRTVVKLLPLLHLVSGAMVLPRPPSSPNHIRHSHDPFERKLLDGKSLQRILQSAAADQRDPDDYRLLEIELQAPAEVDAVNLESLVHTVLKPPLQPYNRTYPQAEIVPNSVLGVREVGVEPNFRGNNFHKIKSLLLHPSTFENLDEKLYYLKSSRPKVYMNVRGQSGSFVKTSSGTTSSENLGILQVTEPFHRQTDWKVHRNKKTKAPKKYDWRIDSVESVRGRNGLHISESSKVSGQASAYNLEDLATTENSMVTSSELPKQIPAPPSRVPVRSLMSQTTPVQRYSPKRSDVEDHEFSSD